MAELLPCPFCGGVACQVYSVWGEGYRYGCLTSGCVGNVHNLLTQFKSDIEAINAWNTRIPKERGGEK